MYTFQTNSLAATGQLLQLKGVNYDKQALKDDLLSHPDYPSLFAIHHTLKKYGVKNVPIEATAEYLNELPQPFLAYMQLPGTGADFAVVNDLYNGSVSYIDGNGKTETIKREDFLKKWKNIALTVEKVDKQEKIEQTIPAFTISNIQYFVAALVLVAILVFVTTLSSAIPLLYTPWLLLKLAGLVITTLLLVYEVDWQNETVKQFCSATKMVNCDAVLQSDGAKIGPFSWSEVGFTYFAGSLLYLLLIGSTTIAYLPLAVLSLLALPYTTYSIYYQYKVVKQWCKLCLIIQCIIVMEFVLIITTRQSNILPVNDSMRWQMSVLLACLLPLPIIGWQTLKPILKKGIQTDGYKYAYRRLLNNPEVFNGMLQRQKAAPAGYEACSLLIGNDAAQNEIIKICNPFCSPCAKAHPILEEIVENNTNVKLRIMFNGSNEQTDTRGKVARLFISLYLNKGRTTAEKAMHFWYNTEDKSLDSLENQYPTVEHPEAAVLKKAMNEWQDVAEVTHTPTIYVNGYRLPETYKVTDLKNILI